MRDSDCSAYDGEFIALAIKLDTKLVTADNKVLRAFPNRAVALAAFDINLKTSPPRRQGAKIAKKTVGLHRLPAW